MTDSVSHVSVSTDFVSNDDFDPDSGEIYDAYGTSTVHLLDEVKRTNTESRGSESVPHYTVHATEMKKKTDIDSSDIKTFEVPLLFNGIDTSTFGISSKFIKNPFLKLCEIAEDPQKSWSDRVQAVRYMQKIPHVDRSRLCIRSTLSIIKDKTHNFSDRFHFFSNNESLIKLDYDIVNACHKYVFENYESLSNTKLPLIYKILSAQYMLTQFPIGTYDSTGVQDFLYEIASDKSMEINYRAECADILDRAGYNEYRAKGRNVIEELEYYCEKEGVKVNLKTIYTNQENVHSEVLTAETIKILRWLIETTRTDRNSSEIYEYLIQQPPSNTRDRAIGSFQRIMIDTARYEGVSILEVLLLVWEKMYSSQHLVELKKRMISELSDSYNTCSSGHLTRTINILSGFETNPNTISFSDQLRANVFARYTACIRTLDDDFQQTILEEMSSSSSQKPTIEEFLSLYDLIRDELESEFVEEYMKKEEFDTVYEKSVSDFFGIKTEKE